MTPRLAKAYAALFDAANRLVVESRDTVNQDLVRAVVAVMRARSFSQRQAKAQCSHCGKTFERPAKELEERRRRSPGGVFCRRSCQVSAQNKTRANG